MGVYDRADGVFGSRSNCLEFDYHCWSCVQVLGKCLIQNYLYQSSSDGNLVDEKCVKVAQAACMCFTKEGARGVRLLVVSIYTKEDYGLLNMVYRHQT